MNKQCFDIGIIQAFLDGELAPEMSAKFTNHIALCDDCAIALAEAEEETAIVFSALDREFDTLVPTQRLWTKINDSIVEEKKKAPFWQKAWSFLALSLANPSFTVAAGIFVIFGIFATVLVMRPNPENDLAADFKTPKVVKSNNQKNDNETIAPISNINNEEAVNPIITASAKRNNVRQNDFKKAVYRVEAKDFPGNIEILRPKTEKAVYLPGEESYVKTIANLTQSVDKQKDNVLRPSAQIAFARDLAVVDNAIKQLQAEVKKNPKNESAKQILYASYQNKIDLLNSVTERNELMASLK